ncbi:DUF72 domain-containing protein [uncultured Sphaerochaeta sp.]|uniref:DUF72 domain-containing protein n=1 Tax=uncultured Sphaerochaeta sp. TaxID=886478 RepID=UPI002A0A37A4|nr:DUF72 domain-containing protein [uncultured Sphaerochaeta sp.]
MANILIGTSGYSYTEWVGPVYPEGTKASEYLSLYADRFETVELNFSYYRMPVADQLQAMHEQAPSLVFSIKAHESLTHSIDPANWKREATIFRSALEPLLNTDSLEAVLLQFPYSFHYEPDQRRYLDALLRFFPGIPLAVEFRNAQWYNNRTLDALKSLKVAFVSLDLPQIQGNPPLMDVSTAPLAYIRLHGRNQAAWWGSDAAARYDYLYSDRELLSIVQRVRGLALGSGTVVVYFNNHRRGQAVKNAQRLRSLLEPKETKA